VAVKGVPAKNLVRDEIIAVSATELLVFQSHENLVLGSSFCIALVP